MYAIAVKTIGCGFRKRGASVRCRAAVGTGSQPAVQSHAQTRGASKQLVRHAHHTFYLPMAGMAQSLNISVACAVTLAQLQVLLPALPGLSDSEREAWLASWLIREVNSSHAVLKTAGLEIDDL